MAEAPVIKTMVMARGVSNVVVLPDSDARTGCLPAEADGNNTPHLFSVFFLCSMKTLSNMSILNIVLIHVIM